MKQHCPNTWEHEICSKHHSLPLSAWACNATSHRILEHNKIALTNTTSISCTRFNGFFSRTTWLSQDQKGKTSLDLSEARDDEVLGWDGSGISWTICKQSAPRSRQITTPTPHHSIFTGRMLFLMPNEQCQSTEGKYQLTPINPRVWIVLEAQHEDHCDNKRSIIDAWRYCQLWPTTVQFITLWAFTSVELGTQHQDKIPEVSTLILDIS